VEKQRIGIVIVSNKKMRFLNKKYRDKSSTTDVLSFNINESLGKDEIYLGDIVISLAEAKKQAKERGVSVEEEFGELVKHGAMHLLGWKHK
jgi:probable rRNA maturation factor